MTKPAIFIGSSSEGLEFSRAARSLLESDGEVTLWNEGLFGVGGTFIDTLVNSLPRFDFAVLVLTPDDMVVSRDHEHFGPRDNVVFELGLFMGKLGRERTFMLVDGTTRTKIPSDLSGVTAASYQWPRNDGNYRAALGAACDDIRMAVRNLGVSDTKVHGAIDQQRRALQEQGQLLFLFATIVTVWEAEHMRKLRVGEHAEYEAHKGLRDELRSLMGRGLIKKTTRGYVHELPHHFDPVEHFRLTELGERLLDMRDRYEKESGGLLAASSKDAMQ